jgi:hypothetical protein
MNAFAPRRSSEPQVNARSRSAGGSRGSTACAPASCPARRPTICCRCAADCLPERVALEPPPPRATATGSASSGGGRARGATRARRGGADVGRCRGPVPRPDPRLAHPPADDGRSRGDRQGLRARQLPVGHVQLQSCSSCAPMIRAATSRVSCGGSSAASASSACSTTGRLAPAAVRIVEQHLSAWQEAVRDARRARRRTPARRRSSSQAVIWFQLVTGDKQPEALIGHDDRACVHGTMAERSCAPTSATGATCSPRRPRSPRPRLVPTDCWAGICRSRHAGPSSPRSARWRACSALSFHSTGLTV